MPRKAKLVSVAAQQLQADKGMIARVHDSMRYLKVMHVKQ